MNDLETTEQPALFDEIDESAFFMPIEHVRKRYTSAQVQGIEFKRSAVLLALGYGCPIEVIARELKMSTRTVQSIASLAGSKVAGLKKEYADALLQMGGASFALGMTKTHEASYLQLVTGGGIMTDKALALTAMGEVGGEKTLKEGRDHVQVAAQLRALMRAPVVESGDLRPVCEGNAADGAPGGVPEAGPNGAGRGGGLVRPLGLVRPMGCQMQIIHQRSPSGLPPMEWERIHFTELARRLAEGGWHWDPVEKKGARGLRLRSPDGSLWDFRLRGKPYVRRCLDKAVAA